jgi:hypothetical protein
MEHPQAHHAGWMNECGQKNKNKKSNFFPLFSYPIG